MNLKEKITNLREDKRGVSPVIGVIMMIAIVVIIAAVVAAFAYGIIGGVNKAPSTAMVVEGAHAGGSINVTIFQHGGDTITEAFNTSFPCSIADKWKNIEMRYNGAKVGSASASGMWMNGVDHNVTGWTTNFEAGDQIKVEFKTLSSGDSIVILHAPSDSILQRVSIM
jgi:flagellin-like protein